MSGWERGRGWGRIWGPDDEAGALNAITQESVLAALRGVTRGRIFDLGVTIDRRSFGWTGHVGTEVIAFRSPEGLVRDGDLPGFDDPGGISFRTSMVVLSDHAGTQIDALSHATFGTDHHWYNDFSVQRDARDFGPARAGGEKIRPIVVSAVLIDVPSHLGVDELEPSQAIGPELLEAALRVDVTPGEAVLVRTGALRHWGELGLDHDKIAGPASAGLTLAAARWLVEEKGAILVASDTPTVEVVPPVDGDNASPVHKYLLVDQGVHMGELHYLEELAAEGAHRFCYVALAPKLKGTTAGFAMRPIAIV